MHRTGGRGIYFLLFLAFPCDAIQRCYSNSVLPSEEGGGAGEQRFPPPSLPEGCSIAAAPSTWGQLCARGAHGPLSPCLCPGPSLSSPSQHFWVTLQSSNAAFKAPLLISRAFCKHQLLQAVNGVAAVDSRKQLKENSPKASRAHFPNSNGKRKAANRGGETQSDALGHFQVLVACGLDCPSGENCKPCFVPAFQTFQKSQNFVSSKCVQAVCPG